ncbi:MAG: aldose 1-epimerase family protein [Chitinophagaceae bacterium]|nr:MAG: aldose 1-epimerase family protein [Chitinophagaceae bacterium]
MEFLENEQLKIIIHPKGAELVSLFDKSSGTEYLWQGDPAFWNKHSPVLFPIVGTLKDNAYFHKDQRYELSRHGFAREMIFDVVKQEKDRIVFSLYSSSETLEKFPFPFQFDISYQLKEKQLQVTYSISNTGDTEMFFSVGGHPAFRLPVDPATVYNDYFLDFAQEENAGRWPISADGLIEKEPIPLLNGTLLPLSKSLFQKDALVFKDLRSSSLHLKSQKTTKGFTFAFEGFPYLGIWAAKDADFVCIEPWCGIADSVDSNQELSQKEGINRLEAGGIFERQWSVEIFK